MIIKLYGVRGSLPSPTSTTEYREKIKKILELAIEKKITQKKQIPEFIKEISYPLNYLIGGNTTCATVTTPEYLFILDGGTGLRILGEEIFQNPERYPKVLYFFITHTHWDHIQGIPFFKPLYLPNYTIHFYSGFEDIEDRLAYQTDERFFPVPFHKTASKKFFHHIKSGSPIRFGNLIEIHTQFLKHPGGCFSYKFIDLRKNKIFIFATDVEITGEDFLGKQEYTDYFSYADILILDSQYTLDESFLKIDWGHTSYTMAVNCAIHWKVKNLILTHHEPNYNDAKLFQNYLNAIRHKNYLEKDRPKIFLAREGMTFEI
ncbi:MAG: MBL fold metallo-hydrolase [Leptonema sp. (in: bacteria)]